MRKIATILACLVLVLPLSVFAQDISTVVENNDNGETPSVPTTATFDIKAYGNQVADYGTGYLDISGYTKTTSYGNTKEWTVFNNAVGTINPCVGASCGMLITQGSFTDTNFSTTQYTEVAGRNLSGFADMTSLGGLAVCTTGELSVPFSGSFYQTQNVSNLVTGTLTPGITGTSQYNGTQTINLKVGGY